MSFMEFEKSSGNLEVEASSTVFFLPRVVNANDASISNRAMIHLRSILDQEGFGLDADRTHIFRIGIDPMTAISKLSELGFYAIGFCSEASVDGGSLMSWTMVHNNRTKPPAVDYKQNRAVGNGQTADEEEVDSEYVPSDADEKDEDSFQLPVRKNLVVGLKNQASFWRCLLLRARPYPLTVQLDVDFCRRRLQPRKQK